MQDTFFVHLGGETKGPYVRDQLEAMWAAGTLTADSVYWDESALVWASVRALRARGFKPVAAKPSKKPRSRREKVFIGLMTILALLTWISFGINLSQRQLDPQISSPKSTSSSLPVSVATPTAEPSAQLAPSDGLQNQENYRIFIRCAYPGIASAGTPIGSAATQVIAQLKASDPEQLSLEEAPLIVAELAAHQVGQLPAKFGPPTAAVGASLQILAIDKPLAENTHSAIRSFYGLNPDGTGWQLFSQNAFNVVHNHVFSFYTDRGGSRANVLMVGDHLQTAANGTATDNLLSLPNLAK